VQLNFQTHTADIIHSIRIVTFTIEIGVK